MSARCMRARAWRSGRRVAPTACSEPTGRESSVDHRSRLAAIVATTFLEDVHSGATVDRHLADQLVLFCALARGTSSYVVPRASAHLESNLWLVAQFGAGVIVEAQTCGDTRAGAEQVTPRRADGIARPARQKRIVPRHAAVPAEHRLGTGDRSTPPIPCTRSTLRGQPPLLQQISSGGSNSCGSCGTTRIWLSTCRIPGALPAPRSAASRCDQEPTVPVRATMSSVTATSM